MLGAPTDYDAWAVFSGGAWDDATLRPYLDRAMETLRVRPVRPGDRTAWHEAVIDAARSLRIPYLEDVNDKEAREGAGCAPLNAVDATRWHTAFAYLDPARDRPNLQVLADSLAVRLEFRGERATGLVASGSGGERLLTADVIALCCGTYGNPPLLMRSGVGPEAVLGELGAAVVHPLPGVGENLTDHSSLGLPLEPLPSLATAMPDAAEAYLAQTVIKARSSLAPDDFWDIHIVPSAGPAEDAQDSTPKPAQPGGIPLIMGGHSAAAEAGRDPDAIELIAEAAPATAGRAAELKDMGVSMVLVYAPQMPVAELTDAFADFAEEVLGPSPRSDGRPLRAR
jgi:choline dehydrogenase